MQVEAKGYGNYNITVNQTSSFTGSLTEMCIRDRNKTNVTYTICAKEMAAMKKTEEYGFLKEVDSIALQQALRHLDTAFQNFFKQPKTGFPRFKSKKRNKNSYSTVCINGNITLSNGYLRLPKIGQVRLKQHRSVPVSYTHLTAGITFLLKAFSCS